MQVICKKCGKEFIRSMKYRSYCEECSTKQYECKVCNKMYQPKRIDADYGCCSSECAKQWKYGEGRKQSYEAKYGEGIQSPFHRKEIQDRIKENCLKKYGVSNHHQRQEVIEATKKTCQEKFGGNAPMSDPIIRKVIRDGEKRAAADSFYKFFEECMPDYTLDSEYRSYLENVDFHHKCGEKFSIPAGYIMHNYRGDVCRSCGDRATYSSSAELELLEYVRQYYPSARKLLRDSNYKWEIDIYIPELKIGFEYNGLYWHSSATGCNRKTHQLKTDYFLDKGIKLFYLWESTSMDINKDIIDSKLGRLDRIYARKCILCEVPPKEGIEFLNNNHMEGSCKAFRYIGLRYNNQLVSVISLRKSYKRDVEIGRYASLRGFTIIGGFQKLIKYIRYDYSKIITYLYRDLCPDYHDSIYHKSGFRFVYDAGPILSYWKENRGLVPRQNYQKHLLKEMFPESYDDNKTELEILEENHIYAVWNSGNFKFELSN